MYELGGIGSDAATSIEASRASYENDATARPPPTKQALSNDISFLNRYGIGYPTLEAAERRAERFDIAPSVALIANGAISETDYFRCVAFELGLEFCEETAEPEEAPFFRTPSPNSLNKMAWMVRSNHVSQSRQDSTFHIAPDSAGISRLKQRLRQKNNVRSRLRVTTLSANRQSLLDRCAPSLLRTAIEGLRERFPKFSARRVISVPQALFLFCGMQVLALMIFHSSTAVMIGCHLFASAFYIGSIFSGWSPPPTSTSPNVNYRFMIHRKIAVLIICCRYIQFLWRFIAKLVK